MIPTHKAGLLEDIHSRQASLPAAKGQSSGAECRAVKFGVLAWAGVVVLGTAIFVLKRADTFTPAVSLQVPATPAYNAYDYFLAASNEIDLTREINPEVSLDTRADRAAARAAIKPYAKVDGYVRLGLLYPYYNRPVVPAALLVPYTAHVVGAAQVLALEARLSANEARLPQGTTDAIAGDHGSLVDRCMNGIEMGQLLTRGSTLWNLPIQAECEDTCRRPLWENLNGLSAGDCRRILKRYPKIEAERTPLADVLRQDKWFGQMQMALAFRKPDWQSSLLGLDEGGSDNKDEGPIGGDAWVARLWKRLAGHDFAAPTTTDRVALLLLTKSRVYHDFTARLDDETSAAEAKRPWPPSRRTDVIADRLTFDGAPMAKSIDSRNEAENRRLMAALNGRLAALTLRHTSRERHRGMR